MSIIDTIEPLNSNWMNYLGSVTLILSSLEEMQGANMKSIRLSKNCFHLLLFIWVVRSHNMCSTGLELVHQ